MELQTRSKFWNADFFREFLRLSIPIILTNLMASSLHIIDNIMVGSLGNTALASVAQANQLTFVMRLTLFGVAGGCAIFSSQHWGVEDVKGVRHVLGISMICALVICFVATLLATVFPLAVMSVYTPDPVVAAQGASYLRIVGPSFLAIGISTVYNAGNRSTERVRLNMVASVSAIAANTFLNWCLIFGNLGMPAMGVEGAALATAIAAIVEAVILIGWTYLKKYPAAAKIKEMLPPSFAFVKRYFRVAFPVILNEGLWSLGTSAYAAVYGRISTQAVAAMSVFNTVDQVMLAAVWGTMNATSVMVGKRIGANKEDDAYLCSQRMMLMGVALAVLMGILLYLTRGSIVTLFNISDEAKALAVSVMGMAAFVLWVRAFNSVNVVGILRAGGDAVYSMVLDGGAIWFIGVPLAFFSGLVLKIPLPYVYLVIQIEEAVKLIIGYRRFLTKKWINNLVEV